MYEQDRLNTSRVYGYAKELGKYEPSVGKLGRVNVRLSRC